mmetsp:Transcript_50153/g.144520  ORF Transcript_50153/g.144520 Transcript_50153/m.144520 type:complete len:351 (-) Transcript_50153:172-1224(-)|eukprot:CAMPEP_0176045918 /NCGR_PEP_ID=MMETSP0120_2-20121206/22798_1 /TAXON_ID=160619 /ORGANISM="Kryptoperidinium foliaceum, Strain CCMP 1326" /LENGTH=350 /DNA_ID=CAMNT_0017379329 /DNA_START=124 /DNA_END=1176 /DNA_ORIENTATION=+
MGKSDDSSTSSDEDGKQVPVKAKNGMRKKRRHKPKDYPKRPLSAYNVFFKETREQILAQKAKEEKPSDEKRDHKLDFQTMAKEIASRWKSLDPKEKERVEKLAKKDMLRYRDEVKAYEEEMVKKNRAEREEAAARAAEKEKDEAAAAAAAAEKAKKLSAERKEKEQEALRAGSGAALAGVAPSSLEALSALAAGRYPQGGADEQALQEALMMHQQRELLQRQLLLEELRAVEERELQLRRLQGFGLLQDPSFSGLQAHQLGGLLGGGGASHAALLGDQSGRGSAGLGGYLGGGAGLLGGGGGLPPELLLGAGGGGGGGLADAYALQQQSLLQEHYARLLGGAKDGAGGGP